MLKNPEKYHLSDVNTNITLLRPNPFSVQYKDIRQKISKKESYDTIFFAYWKYVIKEKSEYQRLIPGFLINLYLKMKREKVKRKFTEF